jgi:hypothetical protein
MGLVRFLLQPISVWKRRVQHDTFGCAFDGLSHILRRIGFEIHANFTVKWRFHDRSSFGEYGDLVILFQRDA